jgi:VWFA-related protein
VAQPIRTFKREDLPVSLGLVIDNSGSMKDKRAKVEAAALALVKGSNPQDETFVVNFNDEAYLDNPGRKDFTSDVRELEQALKRIDSRGGTAMRDALKMSLQHVKGKGKKDKKVLVVITDGNDIASTTTLEELVKTAQQSGVVIYAIGLLSEEDKGDARKAEHALKEITKATGGETFLPKDLTEVDRIAQMVARDIRSQYTITYSPIKSAMDGTFRAIKVNVKAPGNPSARTRTGYYATPDQKAPSGASSFK